jgi:hypothetical protein
VSGPGAAPAGHGAATTLVASALLAATTVASAWCAFQSSVWHGVERGNLAVWSAAQFTASRRVTALNRDVAVDVGTFTSYVAADLRGDRKVALFLRAHARHELRPALEGWIRDLETTGVAEPLPFGRPEYRPAAEVEVEELDASVLSNLKLANQANHTAELFVLHTVLFALALFFLGSMGQANRTGVRNVMFACGTIILAVTTVSMFRLPRGTSRMRDAAHAAAARLQAGDVSRPR